MRHVVLVYEVPLDEEALGDLWPHIPEYLSTQVESYYHLADIDTFDRDVLAAMAEREDLFEILYWAGDSAN